MHYLRRRAVQCSVVRGPAGGPTPFLWTLSVFRKVGDKCNPPARVGNLISSPLPPLGLGALSERGTPGHILDNPFSYLIAIDTYNEIWQQQRQQLWEAAARRYRPCVSSLEPVDDSGREERSLNLINTASAI